MIPLPRAHVHVAAISHPGMKGKNNEDRYGVSAHQLEDKNHTPSTLAIIADGVGGHRAGEVAAEIAVETISRMVAASDSSQPVQVLQEAVIQANQAIYAQASSDPARQGMSTTCVCAWVIGDRLYAASVGDSRLYLLRAGGISQLTTDHTWVQEAIDAGALTSETARNHPNAHIIRRHLGSQQPVVPDFRLRLRPDQPDEQAEANQGMQLLPGDRLLLCTDGLTDLVVGAEILQVLETQPLEDGLDTLVNLANSRGGHDNITLVGLQLPAPVAAVAAPVRRRRRAGIFWFLLLLFLIAAALAAAAYLWMRTQPGVAPTATRQVLPGVQSTLPLAVSPLVFPTLTPTLTPIGQGSLSTPPAASEQASEATGTMALPTFSGPTYTPWPTSTPAAP
ncbi:MAG TPA: PP2C family serine/threonine-protein phosphatase [Anaerolineales bacterium]|nr:PP2C family serine/threonine-protein phosphatase [Anaerolineales bacterium]